MADWIPVLGNSIKRLQRLLSKTLDQYCVSCELLSASIADTLWFVNMVCLLLIAEQNAHEICLTQECLQIVRRLFGSRQQLTAYAMTIQCFTATFDQVLLRSPVGEGRGGGLAREMTKGWKIAWPLKGDHCKNLPLTYRDFQPKWQCIDPTYFPCTWINPEILQCGDSPEG